MARDLKQVTATGDVVAGRAYLHSVVLSGGAATDNTTLEVRDGSAGDVRLTLKALALESVVWTAGDREGVFFGSAIHATVTGTAPKASFEFS